METRPALLVYTSGEEQDIVSVLPLPEARLRDLRALMDQARTLSAARGAAVELRLRDDDVDAYFNEDLADPAVFPAGQAEGARDLAALLEDIATNMGYEPIDLVLVGHRAGVTPVEDSRFVRPHLGIGGDLVFWEFDGMPRLITEAVTRAELLRTLLHYVPDAEVPAVFRDSSTRRRPSRLSRCARASRSAARPCRRARSGRCSPPPASRPPSRRSTTRTAKRRSGCS